MTASEETAIEPVHEIKAEMTLITPAADIEALKKHWDQIQQMKKAILDKSDVQDIQGKVFVKRSGWRKLQSAFAISDRIISKEREVLPDGSFLWRVETEAFHAKSGRSAIGLGTCSSLERKFAHPEHDILAIAHTRSKNRAISDLIGLGEVSAEEIGDGADDSVRPATAPSTANKFCEKCRVTFATPEKLQEHIRLAHDGKI
jgi:hypothetical protein